MTKLFLDSANLAEIEDCLKKDIIQGITTNPSILAKEPKTSYILHIKKIVALIRLRKLSLPLSVEVTTENYNEMIDEAFSLYSESGYPNLNIKIPLTKWENLDVIKKLSYEGLIVNCTCLFNEAQCLIASNAGAKYVSLFRGRMEDGNINADKVISNTRKLLDKADTEIIIGSIRSPSAIIESFLNGAHIVTSGYAHIQKLVFHQKSIDSAAQFLQDFKKWQK